MPHHPGDSPFDFNHPALVLDVETAHHEALQIDDMRTRVLAAGGQIMRCNVDALMFQLAGQAVERWSAQDFRLFAHWMCGYGPTAVMRYDQGLRAHREHAAAGQCPPGCVYRS